jgi:hypothetical protein
MGVFAADTATRQRNGDTTMNATMTKNDAVAKAEAKYAAAVAKLDAANQAVIDAEAAAYAARDARREADRLEKEAAADLEKAQMIARGDEVTSGIDWSEAKSSYSGAAGECCCGCRGNHSDSRVAIKRQINKIKYLAGQGVELDIHPAYVAAENDGRLYIVYFR